MIAGLKVCSVTCTSNRAAIIGDAIKSAIDLVDGCCILDLGMDDAARAAVHAVADPAGKPVHEKRFEWADDMGAARDAALAFAQEAGYGVALVLDTDERIEVRGENLEEALALAHEGVRTWLAPDLDNGYSKPRFIRLPASQEHESAAGCHELYPLVPGELALLGRLGFRELPKTMEQCRTLAAYVVERMTRALSGDVAPLMRVKWFLLRGLARRTVGDADGALADMKEAMKGPCAMTAASAAWLAAEFCIHLERYPDALRFCVRGMMRLPELPELALYAAIASLNMNNPAGAVAWARLAIVHGRFRGASVLIPRTGFVDLRAMWEGPFLVLEKAFCLMEMPEEAAQATADAAAAKAAREAA